MRSGANKVVKTGKSTVRTAAFFCELEAKFSFYFNEVSSPMKEEELMT